eukprot:626520-Rhodomonas_salina.3
MVYKSACTAPAERIPWNQQRRFMEPSRNQRHAFRGISYTVSWNELRHFKESPAPIMRRRSYDVTDLDLPDPTSPTTVTSRCCALVPSKRVARYHGLSVPHIADSTVVHCQYSWSA